MSIQKNFTFSSRLKKRCLILLICTPLIACNTPPPVPQLTGPGYYTVQKGDTLSSIARKFRRSNNEIRIWNPLSNPNDIKVGQILRVAPDQPDRTSTTVTKNKPSNSDRSIATNTVENRLDWAWPATGKSSSSAKGIDILGQLGQPVLAAAAGKIMYSGNGIRGYGNLVIIKHDSNLLSVYAHNKTIIVQEGQMVSKGQKIAEMGQSDSNNVKLYFEIRRQGKPVDPSNFLPPR